MIAALTMSRCLGALALSASVLAGCGWHTPAQQRPTPAGSDDERVRLAVLDTMAGRLETARLVLSGMTWAPSDSFTGVIVERARDQSGPLDTMVADFRARAAAEVELRALNGTRAPTMIVPPAELAPRDGEGAEAYWQRFREVHAPATGWVRITEAGFNESRSSAMVAAEYRCGTRCGWGVLYMLSGGADGWHVADEVMLWIH